MQCSGSLCSTSFIKVSFPVGLIVTGQGTIAGSDDCYPAGRRGPKIPQKERKAGKVSVEDRRAQKLSWAVFKGSWRASEEIGTASEEVVMFSRGCKSW